MTRPEVAKEKALEEKEFRSWIFAQKRKPKK